MDTVTDQDTTSTPPQAPKASLWEDLVDIFISPAELFRRRGDAGWVKPWIILSIIVVALYYVFLGPNHEVAIASTREMMARSGKELPAGAEQGGNIGQIIGGIFQPVGLLIGMLLSGVLLWLASLVAQEGPRFRQALTIVAWAAFPMILQRVLQAVLVIMKTNSGEPLSPMRDTSFGVLRFLNAASLPLPLASALSAVDLFNFWQVALWAVGLTVISRYSAGKAVAVAIAAWLLLMLPLMGFGFIGQAFVG